MYSAGSSTIMSRHFRCHDKPLLRDPEILECDYVPDQVLFRDAELEEMAFHIRPGLHGQRPTSILCRGLPATGKTTCIHHLFTEIRQVSTNLVPVYVNCQRSRTAYAVYSLIYLELVGHAPPSSGIPLRRLMDAVAKALLSKNVVLLVCLDDIHHLIHEKTAGQVISSILRMYLDYPGCRASLILVESDLTLDIRQTLDRSVISSLLAEEVFFAPYSPEQVQGILKERVRRAVYPGVLPLEILDLITDKTIEAGDLRVGIDLLKRSVLRAERAAHITVTEEDVSAAYGDASATHLRGLVSLLTEKERRLLLVITTMIEEGERAEQERREETKTREEKERGEMGRLGKEDKKSSAKETSGRANKGTEYDESMPPTSGRVYARLLRVMAGEPLSGPRAEPSSADASAVGEPGPGYGSNTATPAATCSTTHTGSGPGSTHVSGHGGGHGGGPSSSANGSASFSYSSFYEHLHTLANYSLITITVRQAKGRTSEITLRHPARKMRQIYEEVWGKVEGGRIERRRRREGEVG
ncbi:MULTISPECIES: AAA family ATPase [Methanocalculus]|uniref:AAA family ATPase n=1 Tax=Methanocalculus TaxID=71151 RepID=UPI00209F341F|nr:MULTISPECIES: AAA family ATPase [unclassified Methanocalculus]MCP1662114.1 orc1/cdc6 family replication initiation protein [Methanocalculus sp. AMF5]